MISRVSKRSLAPLLILLAALLAFAALYATRPRSSPISPVEKAWPVAVETVRPANLQPRLTVYGRVETPRNATLTAAVAGDVNKLRVREGQNVRLDELLVEIDDSDYRLALAQREAELAEIEAQVEKENERYETDLASLEYEKSLLNLSRRAVRRAKELADTSVGSQAQLDEARQAEARQALAVTQRKLDIRNHSIRLAELEARRSKAQALRNRALLDLERTRISAPFAGRISRTEVATGDRVRVGDQLLEMYDTQALEVRAQIPTRYVNLISEALADGQRLQVTGTFGQRNIRAELDRLGGQVRRGSGGLDGLFRITAGAELLQVGRTLELALRLPEQHGVVAVPYEALYGTEQVYEMVDGRMRGIVVERVGEFRTRTGERRVLLRSPALAEGSQIIVTQLPNAVEGLRVRAAEPLAPLNPEQLAQQ